MRLILSIFRRKQLIALLATLVTSVVSAQTALEPGPENSLLDADLFYEVLVGEISAQAGDSSAGFALILDAARKANAVNLFERATQIALGARNGEAALQAAQSWARAYPQSVNANRYLVQILVGLNRLPETVAPLKRSLRAMSLKDKLATIESLPRSFARASDRNSAAISVEKALAGEVANLTAGPLAWSVIGQMRLQANDSLGALSAAKRGFSLNPQSVAPVALALALLGAKVRDAEALVQSYLEESPAPEVRVAYIRQLVSVGQLAQAYEQTKRLTQQNPTYPEGWLVRGSIEEQDRKFTQAEVSVKKYLELRAVASLNSQTQPSDRPWATAHFLLAQIADQDGRFAEALQYLQRISSPPDALVLGTRQASTLAKLGKLDAGVALLRALPEDQPGAAKSKLNAEIQLLRENKKTQQAYETAQAALLRFPEDLDLKYDLAMMAEKEGKLDTMEELMRQVIAAKPDSPAAYNAMGYSFADRNIRLGEARQLIAKALEYAPEDPSILDSMGWLEFRSGNTQEAIRLLQYAFKSQPDAEIAAHLGEALWSAGQKTQASAIWDQGLKISPQNETLLETTRRLRGTP